MATFFVPENNVMDFAKEVDNLGLELSFEGLCADDIDLVFTIEKDNDNAAAVEALGKWLDENYDSSDNGNEEDTEVYGGK